MDQILEHYRNQVRRYLAGRIVDRERIRRIDRLNPSRWATGTMGYDGYILIEFSWSGAVLLECLVVGNATYILWGEWKGMLQLTKAELCLKANCLCVIHTENSFNKVEAALAAERNGIPLPASIRHLRLDSAH